MATQINTGKSHTLPIPGISFGAVWPKLPDAKSITSELLPHDGSKPLKNMLPCQPWPGFQPAHPTEPVSAAPRPWDLAAPPASQSASKTQGRKDKKRTIFKAGVRVPCPSASLVLEAPKGKLRPSREADDRGSERAPGLNSTFPLLTSAASCKSQPPL